jgi:hypothetical protein
MTEKIFLLFLLMQIDSLSVIKKYFILKVSTSQDLNYRVYLMGVKLFAVNNEGNVRKHLVQIKRRDIFA